MQVNAMLLLLIAAPVMAKLRGAGDQTLMTDMQPVVVRRLLSNVEQKWIQTRALALANMTDNEQAFAEMEKSCVKVSMAIVAGSEGQKDHVTEYMQDVCASGTHDDQALCSSFASGVTAEMTDDSEYNRDELKLSTFCRKFWDRDVTNAAQVEAKKRSEEAKKEADEKEEAKERQEADEKEDAARAAEVKDYQAAEAAKAAQAAATRAQTNETSAASTSVTEANATVTPVEAAPAAPVEEAQANSTVEQTTTTPAAPVEEAQANSTLEQTTTTPAPATQENSTAPAAPAPEKKTNTSFIAKTAVKNATAALKNATAAIKK